MREVPSRQQALHVARELGAKPYSTPPMRAVTGVSFTFEQLDQFVNKMINPNALIVDKSEGSSTPSQWQGHLDKTSTAGS